MPYDTIAVTFIDDASSEPIGSVELQAANLPDTFELETTLHLGGADWSVMDAEPRTKAEFVGKGKLVLRLRKVEKVDLSDILYSLPSICDRIPAVLDSAPDGDDVILAEDDWRQVELISRAFAGHADAEIAAISAIHEQERASVGWKKIHVRKRPDPPIASSLSRADIEEAFGGVTFRGVCFGDLPIAGGFSFRLGELECYGIEEDGAVTVLGFGQGKADEAAVEALSRLAHKLDLELAYWCRCVRAAWDDPLFRQLLTGAV